jgi:filamentous hemagglutinin
LDEAINTREPLSILMRQAEGISTAKPYQSTVPRDLNEQALWNRVLADPSAGRALRTLNSDPRFPQAAGFMKMEASHKLPDGSAISIHYQVNSVTSKVYDIKITTPQRSVLQPGPTIK